MSDTRSERAVRRAELPRKALVEAHRRRDTIVDQIDAVLAEYDAASEAMAKVMDQAVVVEELEAPRTVTRSKADC